MYIMQVYVEYNLSYQPYTNIKWWIWKNKLKDFQKSLI